MVSIYLILWPEKTTNMPLILKKILNVIQRQNFPFFQLALQIGKIYSNTTQWLGRTVMVQGNDVEQAMNVLNGIMANEGMIKRFKLTRRYEKPKYARSRINFERNKAIYNEDMDNRIKLMLRKNRKDPYPGNTC